MMNTKPDRLFGAIGSKLPRSALVAALLLFPPLLFAQVSVTTPGVKVNTGAQGNVAVSIGAGNSASNTSGGVDTDVEMEGVAVINGDVFIDGEKIPRGKPRHTGKKSGIKYRITWGKDGNIAVAQE